jgi:hypothetical protein
MKEYYVSQDFNGSRDFKVYGTLLLTRNRLIRLQEKGSEYHELNTEKKFKIG